MSLNYSISMRANPQNPTAAKKAYAMAQIGQRISLKEMAQRISAQTTVSRADVSAVLVALEENMLAALRNGDQVEFADLGRFRLALTSRGAESADKFTSDYITGVRVVYSPGEELRALFVGMNFNAVPTRAAVRAVLKAQKEGKTLVDISPDHNGSTTGGGDDKPGTGGNEPGEGGESYG